MLLLQQTGCSQLAAHSCSRSTLALVLQLAEHATMLQQRLPYLLQVHPPEGGAMVTLARALSKQQNGHGSLAMIFVTKNSTQVPLYTSKPLMFTESSRMRDFSVNTGAVTLC